MWITLQSFKKSKQNWDKDVQFFLTNRLSKPEWHESTECDNSADIEGAHLKHSRLILFVFKIYEKNDKAIILFRIAPWTNRMWDKKKEKKFPPQFILSVISLGRSQNEFGSFQTLRLFHSLVFLRDRWYFFRFLRWQYLLNVSFIVLSFVLKNCVT